MQKAALLCLLIISLVTTGYAQEKFQLSSHILDITAGKPAAHVTITLSRQDKNGNWERVEEKQTDDNGRINDLLKQDGKSHVGIYKLTYHTAPYFQRQKQKSFYPFIEVVFELVDNEHYHVPITLSPYGYSTYRGS